MSTDLFGQLLPSLTIDNIDGRVPHNVWLVGQERSRDQRAGRYLDRITHTQKMVPELCRHMLAYLKLEPGSVVLDPFLGTGTTAVECAHAGYRCRGVDLIPEFVQEARANLEAMGVHTENPEDQGPSSLHNQHELRVGDALRLPWDDKTVDACVTSPAYGDSDPIHDSNGESIHKQAADGNGYAQYIVRTSGYMERKPGPAPLRGAMGSAGRLAWEAMMFLALGEIRRVLKPDAYCLIAAREYWLRKGSHDMIDLPDRIIDLARHAGLAPCNQIYALDSALDQFGQLKTRATMHQINLAKRMQDRPCARGVPGVTRVLVLQRRDRKKKTPFRDFRVHHILEAP